MTMTFYKSCLTCSEIFRPIYDGQTYCQSHDRDAEPSRAAPIAARATTAGESSRSIPELAKAMASREARAPAGERKVTRFGKRKSQLG